MAGKLKAAGLTDFVVLTDSQRVVAPSGLAPYVRPGIEVSGYRFDDTICQWTVHTTGGEVLTARIVVVARRPPSSTVDVIGRGGLAIPRDGTSASQDVAVAGFPNLFLVPDLGSAGRSVRYIMACIRMMGREDARGIEIHQHVQDSPSRWPRRPDPRHFRFTPFEDDVDETHRGPAVLTAESTEIDVRVHLTGHVQPIDGSYRWFGRIARHPEVTALHKAGRDNVTVRLPGGEAAKAKLTEIDPWGNVRVTGTGRPPFPLS
jgi:hypothetical protein